MGVGIAGGTAAACPTASLPPAASAAERAHVSKERTGREGTHTLHYYVGRVFRVGPELLCELDHPQWMHRPEGQKLYWDWKMACRTVARGKKGWV